ncbi:MAG: hypothetical protein MI919_06090 [Holophagales bacterium]|nr:hypothetical protein [Holophagales bacterium]
MKTDASHDKDSVHLLDDLDQAFEGLDVKPLSNQDLSRVSGGTLGCDTVTFTCNSKCGPTGYWECG